jgi:pilus assembly protein CpaE
MAADEKIRVLIVDDVADTRENVRKLLQFESDIEVVGAAQSGTEGVQMSRELDPDVVIMDINMPDLDGIAATEQIIGKQPHVQVVILSVQGEQSYMRKAMLAGARDFLTKPPMADELLSAIRRAGAMSVQERMKVSQARTVQASGGQSSPVAQLSKGKVIAVYSPKGGTGCTTIAVNLALLLHNSETRVVLVDGNLQYGDVAVFVNEQGKNTIIDLASRIEELDPEIVESVMITHETGAHILAAPIRPEHAEKVSGDQFTRLIEYLSQMYAYVVVDTASLLTDATLGAIDKCNVLILVVTQDIPSIKNARLFLDLLGTLGIPRERVVFTMNRYDKRIAITPERVGENLKQPVVAVIPLDERVVIPAVNRGVPFILDNKTQPAGKGILSVAEGVRASLRAQETVDEPDLIKR